MSTRCVVDFTYNGRIEAKVYRHSDGYPDGPSGVPADLDRFFAAVEHDTRDTRYDDPTYLAAKFVVWQAAQNAREYFNGEWRKSKSLNFLGVGICMENPGDIEFIYTVNCSLHGNPNNRPVVTWRTASS